MKQLLIIPAILAGALFINGCASSQPSCSVASAGCGDSQKKAPGKEEEENNLNIPAFPYKPIIGTRNNDAKMIVDTGVVLKVYIATYKDSKRTLVAAHDRYAWAKEPGFVVGSDRPDVRKRTGMLTPASKAPFVFGGGEIDSTSIENNTKITNYLSAIAESEKRDTAPMENMTSADERFDGVIKNYVNKTKGN